MVHDTDAKRMGAPGDCAKLQSPASGKLKRPPDTETAVPGAPEDGLRSMNAVVGGRLLIPVTVKTALAVSPVLPLTVIIYVPWLAELATVNPVPVNCPEAVMVHEGVGDWKRPGELGDCKRVQEPASGKLKPPPVTEIAAPTVPDVGLTTMAGPMALVTVEVVVVVPVVELFVTVQACWLTTLPEFD
jgi:hypothetical protein